MIQNKMKIEFLSKSENEGLARIAVAAFVSQLDPTIEEITDVKTAVSEAVTNAIIHGYKGNKESVVYVECEICDLEIKITIKDDGVGIKNVKEAREPLYTSRPDLERSGMGFTVMETFMDKLDVTSVEGKGTTIVLTKRFKSLS